jgi:excisionase family DNA binding protein
MAQQQVSIEPGALSVAAFCQWAGVSRAWAYERIRDGTIRSVKRGGRRLIPLEAAREWLEGR